MAVRAPETRRRHTSLSVLFVGGLIVLSMLFSACGSSTSTTSAVPTTNPATPTIAPPNDLVTPGTLTVGSDTTYPPQEFIDTATGQAIGFDVDLITEIAQRMGLKAKVVTTGFDTIIDSLSARRFDVVISAITINDERKKKVDFVPYLKAGESLLVQKGNPKNLKSVNDLCGLNVGVQNGTVEHSDLTIADKACKTKGKPGINLTILQNQTEVVQLLVTGRVVATYQDSPVTVYYLKQHPGQFEVGGAVVNATPEGIAIRKGDSAMLNTIQTAFNQLKADGSYHKLILKWGLTNEELTIIDHPSLYV